jgi:hypothetical protein
MTKRIDPGLFACLMKMSSEPRRDLLEFIGQTPVDAKHLVDRFEKAAVTQPPQAADPARR